MGAVRKLEGSISNEAGCNAHIQNAAAGHTCRYLANTRASYWFWLAGAEVQDPKLGQQYEKLQVPFPLVVQ